MLQSNSITVTHSYIASYWIHIVWSIFAMTSTCYHIKCPHHVLSSPMAAVIGDVYRRDQVDNPTKDEFCDWKSCNISSRLTWCTDSFTSGPVHDYLKLQTLTNSTIYCLSTGRSITIYWKCQLLYFAQLSIR